MAGCGGGGHGGNLPHRGVPAPSLALPERDVRAVSALLRRRVCYPGVSHHCVQAFGLEEGTSHTVGGGTNNTLEEGTRTIMTSRLADVIVPVLI